MRLRSLGLAVTLTIASLTVSVRAMAQEPAAAQPAAAQPAFNLPVSVERIRGALAQPAPVEPLKGLNEPTPTFRIEISEQQKFDLLVSKLKFEKGGPQIAGGVDAYDQYQRIFPRINNPLVQPYGAFSTGEIVTLSIEALIEKYVAQKMLHVVGNAMRAQAEREAREEVARSLAQFWAAQPADAAVVPPKE